MKIQTLLKIIFFFMLNRFTSLNSLKYMYKVIIACNYKTGALQLSSMLVLVTVYLDFSSAAMV